jgi:hypothetical protein
MKYLLAILVLCFPALSATKYPAYTDNANATTFTGGATNFATVASLTALSNSVPASTNISLLNGTNVFTGTNRFTGTVILTNAASTLSGNGSGLTNLAAGNIASGTISDARLSSNVPQIAGTNVFTGSNIFPAGSFYLGNGIGLRNLYAQSTNINVASVAVSATPLTNNGAFASTTRLLEYQMPALLGSNSQVSIYTTIIKTSTQPSNISICYYVGTNTNSVFYTATLANTAIASSQSVNPTFLFANAHGFQTQLAFSSSSWGGGLGDARNLYPSNYVDTSVPWKLYIGIWGTSACTNISVPILRVEEWVSP